VVNVEFVVLWIVAPCCVSDANDSEDRKFGGHPPHDTAQQPIKPRIHESLLQGRFYPDIFLIHSRRLA
jgi:hypothetical protein